MKFQIIIFSITCIYEVIFLLIIQFILYYWFNFLALIIILIYYYFFYKKLKKNLQFLPIFIFQKSSFMLNSLVLFLTLLTFIFYIIIHPTFCMNLDPEMIQQIQADNQVEREQFETSLNVDSTIPMPHFQLNIYIENVFNSLSFSGNPEMWRETQRSIFSFYSQYVFIGSRLVLITDNNDLYNLISNNFYHLNNPTDMLNLSRLFATRITTHHININNITDIHIHNYSIYVEYCINNVKILIRFLNNQTNLFETDQNLMYEVFFSWRDQLNAFAQIHTRLLDHRLVLIGDNPRTLEVRRLCDLFLNFLNTSMNYIDIRLNNIENSNLNFDRNIVDITTTSPDELIDSASETVRGSDLEIASSQSSSNDS